MISGKSFWNYKKLTNPSFLRVFNLSKLNGNKGFRVRLNDKAALDRSKALKFLKFWWFIIIYDHMIDLNDNYDFKWSWKLYPLG